MGSDTVIAGMFSRCYHHDQMAPDASPAPPTPFTTCQPLGAGLDHLSAHHHRLESLLDSALATLTLIRDNAPSAAPPTFSSHMTQVLRALLRHTLAPSTPCPIADAVLGAQAPQPEPQPAAYAQTAASTATDYVVMPKACEPNKMEPSSTSPFPSPLPTRSAPVRPDLIFRFDLEPRCTRPHPSAVFKAIIAAKPVIGSSLTLVGVQWTHSGNLSLNLVGKDGATVPAKDCLARVPAIWGAIRVLLGFSNQHACPRVDTGEPWHAVVIHNVPVLPCDEPSFIPADWLELGGFRGKVENFSFMCGLDELFKKNYATVRVSLSSYADAELLVEKGALLFGSRCAVSHYVSKPRGRTPQR
jgi:hypothetical protein